jgi:hypothetical protein
VAEKQPGKAASAKAFVISQIGEEGSDARTRADDVLDFIIGPVAEKEYNLEVARSDRDPTPGQVTSRLVKSILESRVIIAELTGRNPNVYYELGVLHSFGLPVVILVDRADSLTFDTQHERVIEIGDDGTITVRQADIAKKKLREALAIVLKEDYRATSLVTEVADRQSVAKLASSDAIASQILTINDKLDDVMAMLHTARTRSVAGTPGFPSGTLSFGPSTFVPTDPRFDVDIAQWHPSAALQQALKAAEGKGNVVTEDGTIFFPRERPQARKAKAKTETIGGDQATDQAAPSKPQKQKPNAKES